MYLNHYPQRHEAREITLNDDAAYRLVDAEGMLDAMVQGCTASCTLEDAKRVLFTLEDGEVLKALGLTDADQVWIENLHADIKAALQKGD
jgi:hypothetical protein